MKNIFLLGLALITLGTATSCSKDDDKKPVEQVLVGSTKEHKVTFKIIGSSDTEIQNIMYGTDTSIVSSDSEQVNTWTKEITAPKGTFVITLSATLSGASATSSAKIQILVDGNVVKETTANGALMTAQLLYEF